MATVPTQHRTTAAAGIGGSASIVLMSLLLHFNVHLTEEEAIAWTAVIIGAGGFVLKKLEAKYPTLAPELDEAQADITPYLPMIKVLVQSEVARLTAPSTTIPAKSTITGIAGLGGQPVVVQPESSRDPVPEAPSFALDTAAHSLEHS